jgi:phosphopantothenoylcysteine decarboxylase/phosphopantothenate--cysteine ligase
VAQLLLGCGASAALHKACDLASKLAQEGHRVRVLLTPRAAQLVAPQLFEALTGEPAASDEFDAARRGAMDHIELSQWAELLLVAPATADLVSRLALGLAGDLVTTTALALEARVPRLIAPAMNPNMLAAPPVRRNLETLCGDGWRVVAPDAGHMACGVDGPGRLPEVDALLAAVRESLG